MVDEGMHIDEDYSRDSGAVSRLCRLLLAVLVAVAFSLPWSKHGTTSMSPSS